MASIGNLVIPGEAVGSNDAVPSADEIPRQARDDVTAPKTALSRYKAWIPNQVQDMASIGNLVIPGEAVGSNDVAWSRAGAERRRDPKAKLGMTSLLRKQL